MFCRSTQESSQEDQISTIWQLMKKHFSVTFKISGGPMNIVANGHKINHM
jgi:hypothetical protein